MQNTEATTDWTRARIDDLKTRAIEIVRASPNAHHRSSLALGRCPRRHMTIAEAMSGSSRPSWAMAASFGRVLAQLFVNVAGGSFSGLWGVCQTARRARAASVNSCGVTCVRAISSRSRSIVRSGSSR